MTGAPPFADDSADELVAGADADEGVDEGASDDEDGATDDEVTGEEEGATLALVTGVELGLTLPDPPPPPPQAVIKPVMAIASESLDRGFAGIINHSY